MDKSNENEIKVHVEDFEDALKRIEISFQIHFEKDELVGIKIFGELCDIVLAKTKSIEDNSCTTQQAFYKLRQAILQIEGKDKIINTQMKIKELFPYKTKKKIKLLEKTLGFKLNIFLPMTSVVVMLTLTSLFSFILLFINWYYGLLVLVFSIFLLILNNKINVVFDNLTMGELAEKLSLENYKMVRRDKNSINKSEIINKIEKIFLINLPTNLTQIKYDTAIIYQTPPF